MDEMRERLSEILKAGLSKDPAEHAEQVARIGAVLTEAFERVGLRCTVVGGSAIEVHAPGIYKSGDIDVVIETARGISSDPNVQETFNGLGFRKRGMLWVIGELAVHVVSSHLEEPGELLSLGEVKVRVVTKEAILADRVIAFKWAKHTSYAQQAIDMLAAFGDVLDRDWLYQRLETGFAYDAFVELERFGDTDEPVSEEVLRGLLKRLHGRTGN
jgi:hypothetical protein